MYDLMHIRNSLVGVYRDAKYIYIITDTHTHMRARIPFAHTHGIHFCIRTYFHTFAPTYMRCTSTRLGVLSNSADGGRACAFGVCACVRGKSTAASSSTNTTKTREREREIESVMEERWIITIKVHTYSIICRYTIMLIILCMCLPVYTNKCCVIF